MIFHSFCHHIQEKQLAEDYGYASTSDSTANFKDMEVSKRMNLVALESKISALATPNTPSGHTTSLRKPSSPGNLKTAVVEVSENELPSHRPRPHLVHA